MFLKERDTCQGCPVSCKQVFENEDEDPYRRLDPVYGGAEYEAMAAFGSCCDVQDNLAVLKANELANAYGLDAISTGMSIAFVMECFENGILTAADTGGLEYRWGDADLLVRSVEMIARREGFGDVMAEGVARMAARFGPRLGAVQHHRQGPGTAHARAAPQAGHGRRLCGRPGRRRPHDEHARHGLLPSDGGSLRRVNSAACAEPVGPVPPGRAGRGQAADHFPQRAELVSTLQDCALICQFYCLRL